MSRTLSIFLVLASTWCASAITFEWDASPDQWVTGYRLYTHTNSMAAGTNLTANDYWQGLNHSQNVALTGTVCRVYVQSDTHTIAERTAYVQFRTDRNGGGTQVGGNSNTNTVQAGVAEALEFTWASDAPVSNGDIFLNVISVGGGNFYLRYDSTGGYDSTTYYASYDATAKTGQDLWFIICTQ